MKSITIEFKAVPSGYHVVKTVCGFDFGITYEDCLTMKFKSGGTLIMPTECIEDFKIVSIESIE